MPANDTIKIETIIHAPVSRVWQAWTDPKLILRWFGSDPKGIGVNAKLDLRPGGSFDISFQNSDHSEHTCYGVYLEIAPTVKLRFSWTWKSEPGVESFVSVILLPENDNTRLVFEHANVGTKSSHDYLMGWNSSFEKLDKVLTS